MICQRCSGLMVISTDTTMDGWQFDLYRCLNCGEAYDERILANRALTPDELKKVSVKSYLRSVRRQASIRLS